MIKKRALIKNALVFGIVLLFIGLAVQPSTANFQSQKVDIEPKDLLFQTIIDIANNQEFQNLIAQEKNNGFILDIDSNTRNLCSKLLFKNPELLNLLFSTKNSINYNQLDFAYKQGCEIIKIIGEDKALEIIESIKITNSEFSEGLSEILTNDEEIYNKISTLKSMNQEIDPTLPIENPILCGIIMMLTFTFAIPMVSLCVIFLALSSRPILGPLFVTLLFMFSANLALFLKLVQRFC